MYTARGPTGIQYAWYACVLLWIIMNISYLACLVWKSRWYLSCLSPVHLDPIHVLAFKNVPSLSPLPLSLSFLCLNHGMYSLSRKRPISLVWRHKISCCLISTTFCLLSNSNGICAKNMNFMQQLCVFVNTSWRRYYAQSQQQIALGFLFFWYSTLVCGLTVKNDASVVGNLAKKVTKHEKNELKKLCGQSCFILYY